VVILSGYFTSSKLFIADYQFTTVLTCFNRYKKQQLFFPPKKRKEKKKKNKDMLSKANAAAAVKVFEKKILPEA